MEWDGVHRTGSEIDWGAVFSVFRGECLWRYGHGGMRFHSGICAAAVCVVYALTAGQCAATTHYVNLGCATPFSPYTNWPTAATNIQDAIDAASAGDVVLVAAGIYSNGGRVVYGQMTNRVVVDKAIAVVASNADPSVTHIVGFNPTNSPYDRAVRSVYLANGATLSGFTVRDGATRRSGDSVREQNGGGAFCEPNATISNCVIAGNYANYYGGGVRGGVVYNSTVVSNFASSYGGGAANCTIHNSTVTNNQSVGYGGGTYSVFAYDTVIANNRSSSAGGGTYLSTLTRCRISANFSSDSGGGSYQGSADSCWYEGNSANNSGGATYSSDLGNCVVVDNDANNGGGVYSGSSSNCTIANNYAFSVGGGTYSATLKNSIIYSNAANSPEANYSGGSFSYCCTDPLPSGTSNFTSAPKFDGSTFALASNSPCIDAGLDNGLTYDYQAQVRPLDGNGDGVAKPDVGAYEFLNGGADSDGDGLTDDQELSVYHTNPANSDSDGDGMYDGWEVANGLSPTTAQAPTISPTNVVATDGSYPNKVRVTWSHLQAFRRYEVWRGNNSDSNQASLLVTDVSTNVVDDSNSLPYQVYFYWVRAKNDLGVGGLSVSDSGLVLSPPTNVSATDASFEDRVRVTWDQAVGATSYEVWRGTSDSTSSATLVTSSVTTNFYDYTTSNPTNLHYFWIKAKNAAGVSVFSSNDVGFVRITPPTGVSATDATFENSVRITWNTVTGASGYQVWRSTNDNSDLVVLIGSGVGTNSFIDGTATGAVSYFYWVSASNALSASILSSSNSGYWIPAPTGVQASDGDFVDRVRVSWTQSAGATAYEVWRALSDSTSSATRVASSVTTNVYDYMTSSATDLQYFWVKAKDASGVSGFSSNDTGFVRIGPPTGVSATDGTVEDAVRITWNVVSGASGYQLWRSTNDDSTKVVLLASDLATNAFVDGTATGGVWYFYWVSSSNALSVSSLSSSNSGYWLPTPTDVRASDGAFDDRVRITWTQSAGAVSYDVWWSLSADTNSAATVALGVTTNTYDFMSLDWTNMVFFWIKARNGGGASGFSSNDAGFVRIGTPTSVAASDGTVDYAINVTWDAVSSATGYQLWRSTNDNSGLASLVASNLTTNSFLDISTTGAVTYFYWVSASNGMSVSSLSASNSGYWISPPTAVDASDGTYTDRIVVSWSLPTGISSVEVWRSSSASTGTASRIADNVPGTSYDDFTVSAGQIRYYWVKSKSPAGSSGFSASNSGYRGLAAPLGVTASDRAFIDKVSLSWVPVTGAGSYELWRSATNNVNTAVLLATNLTGSAFDDMSAYGWRTNYYWMRAVNPGQSAFSTPDAGTKREVDASDDLYSGFVRIAWSSADGATNYEVWRNVVDESGSASKIADNLATNSYDDTSAFPSQLYYYWVKPKDGPILRFSLSDTGIRSLSPPSTVQASNGASTETIDVTWSAVGGATSYEVWRNTVNNTNSAVRIATNISVTSYSDNPSLQGFVYYYWVRAVSVFSRSGFGTPDWGFRRLSTPQSVNASDGTPDDKVVVTWQPVLGAVFYEVWRNVVDNTNGATVYADFISDTSYNDVGGDLFTPHYYWVRAKNAVSTSDFSVPDTGFAGLSPTLDSDGDGVPDVQENYAGTNPNDSNSFLRLVMPAAEVFPSGGGFAISWMSVSTKQYRIEMSTNLTAGIYSNIVVGLPATPPINVYTDMTTSVSGPRLYRIGVE